MIKKSKSNLYKTEVRKLSVRQATVQTFISKVTAKYFYRKRHRTENCNKIKID